MKKSTIFGLASGVMMAMAINANAATPAYVLDPASGSVVKDVSTITIDFTDQHVEFYENSRMAPAVLVNTDTQKEYVCQDPMLNPNPGYEGAKYTMVFMDPDSDEWEPILIAGNYELTVRGMYVDVNGEMEDVDVITANYTIKYAIDYVLNPAPGLAGNLQDMTITFPNNKVSFPENNRMPSIILAGPNGHSYECNSPILNTRYESEVGCQYNIKFNELNDEYVPEFISEPGEYELTIRSMYYGDEEDPQYLLPIVAAYTVDYPVAYTLDPASGTTVEDLTTITITFTDDQTVAFYEGNRMPVAVLENVKTGKTYVCNEAMLDTRAMTDGKAYTLTFVNEEDDDQSPVNVPGYYTLTIRGMYNEDGDVPPIYGEYFINYPVPYYLRPVENAQVASIEKVTLQFPITPNVAFYENNRIPVAVIQNLDNGKEYVCQEADINTRAEFDEGQRGIEYQFTFVDEDGDVAVISEPGQYELAIRAMYLENENGDNVDLPRIITKYTIPYPVEYVLNPDNGASVANLQGITVTFPNNSNVVFYENNRMPVAVLENTTTGKTYNCETADRNTRAEQGSEYTFTFIGTDDEEAMPITEPGQYTLAIRALYLEEGDDLPVIYANYTVPYPIQYWLNPDNGASVENLQGIVLQFPNNNNVVFYENNRIPVAVLENTTTGKIYNCEVADRNTRAEGSEYSFTFIGTDDEEAMPITEPGQYTLAIRAMYLETEGEEPVDLPVLIANYTIPYPVEYYLNPDNGANVENLQGIVLQFPNNTNVVFYENNRMPVAVLENTTTGKTYNCETADRNTRAEGSEYSFTFIGTDDEEAMPITEPGQYELTIRAMYLEEGEDNVDLPVIYANYTIPYPVEYYLNPDNGASVENLQGIVLQFPNNNNVVFYENNRMPVAVLENTTNGKLYNCEVADRNTRAEGSEYSFTFIGTDDEEAMPITEPGKYELTIRALYLENEGEDNVDLPVIIANYTIEYPVQYWLNPDNGANVENLQTVTIDFPENKNVAFYENSNMAVAVLVNTTTGAEYQAMNADRNTHALTEGVAYDFNFIGVDEEELMPITEPGNYELTIRALYLEEEGGNVDLPVIIAKYTIPYPVEYILTPDNGASVENLMTVSIDFPNNTNVAFYENNTMPIAVLVNNKTQAEYVCYEADRDTKAMTEGIAYSLTFIAEGEEEAEPITDLGTYTLTIRALYMTVPGEEGDEQVDLPVITANYTINYPVEYVLSPMNGDLLEQIESVSLEFPYNNNVAFYENNPMPVAVLVNTMTNTEYVCNEADRNTFAPTDGILYVLNFMNADTEEYGAICEDGIYTLTIRALYMTVDGEEETEHQVDLPVIEATYTIASSGVKAVELVGESDVYNVYNFNGIQLVMNGTANDVKNLPAGLYIINGKKVIIRK